MKWRKGLPEKSGKYVVITNYGAVATYPYSEKYKTFNAYDENSEDVIKECKLNHCVEMWVPLEEFMKDQGIDYEET